MVDPGDKIRIAMYTSSVGPLKGISLATATSQGRFESS